MKFLCEAVLNGVDASVNQKSTAVDASYLVSASVQVVVSGTAVGTVQLQGSNDNFKPATDWSNIPSASVAINGAGTYLIPKLDVCYQNLQVVYTATSGTGSLTAYLKTLGF